MSNKRRLLKDLPFLTKGHVVNNYNGTYSVKNGQTYYGGSSSGSDRGTTTFSQSELDVIDLSWGNPEWFEPATLDHIKIIPHTDKIVLEFKPIDHGDARSLAMGIQHILHNLSNETVDNRQYTWDEFKDITTEFGN